MRINRQQSHRALIYLTLLSILLLPLRGLADTMLYTHDEASTGAPCHSMPVSTELAENSEDIQANCCASGNLTGCAHCFISLGLQSHTQLGDSNQSHIPPNAPITQLSTTLSENRYKPPRS